MLTRLNIRGIFQELSGHKWSADSNITANERSPRL
jgi:hypothetical protein